MEKEESSNNLAVSTKGKRLSCNLRVKQNRVVLDRMLKKKRDFQWISKQSLAPKNLMGVQNLDKEWSYTVLSTVGAPEKPQF